MLSSSAFWKSFWTTLSERKANQYCLREWVIRFEWLLGSACHVTKKSQGEQNSHFPTILAYSREDVDHVISMSFLSFWEVFLAKISYFRRGYIKCGTKAPWWWWESWTRREIVPLTACSAKHTEGKLFSSEQQLERIKLEGAKTSCCVSRHFQAGLLQAASESTGHSSNALPRAKEQLGSFTKASRTRTAIAAAAVFVCLQLLLSSQKLNIQSLKLASLPTFFLSAPIIFIHISFRSQVRRPR